MVVRTDPSQHAASAQKLYMENTLLRTAGALFCHDAKRAADHTTEIRLTRGSPENAITIRPDPQLGQPGPLAHKVFLAIIKKHSDYGRPVQTEISFTRREIGRLIGRKVWGGRDSEQLSRALHEIHYTFIKAHFKNSTGRLVEHSFNIFPQIWIERREFASDPIEACTVTLAEPILASLRDEHFTCLNHDRIGALGTIGQALYMRLFFHFANLYDGKNSAALRFQKRYEDICLEWLGGLTVLKHRSKILGEQLGAHLEQLTTCGFLSRYSVDDAKQRDGLLITFHPGKEFFQDYDRFYRTRRNPTQQPDPEEGRRSVGDPLRVAYMFTAKRLGVAPTSVTYVPTNDVESAKLILTQIPLDEASSFIDYALTAAQRTGFNVQTLGGLKQYIAPYQADRHRRQVAAVRRAAEATEAAAKAQQVAYEDYRRAAALRIFEGLPPEIQRSMKAEISSKQSFSGPLGEFMARGRLIDLVTMRYADSLTTFDDWKAQHPTPNNNRGL